MEILLIAIVAVVVAGIWYVNRNPSKLDINKDGKIDANDIKGLVEIVAAKADVNKDGKVDAADVKAAVKKTAAKAQTAAKKTVTKAKEAVKKASSGRGRKPRSKA
jgi:FtsZ-interacting cell division protein ZipA